MNNKTKAENTDDGYDMKRDTDTTGLMNQDHGTWPDMQDENSGVELFSAVETEDEK